jgi:hypothetical protein
VQLEDVEISEAFEAGSALRLHGAVGGAIETKGWVAVCVVLFDSLRTTIISFAQDGRIDESDALLRIGGLKLRRNRRGTTLGVKASELSCWHPLRDPPLQQCLCSTAPFASAQANQPICKPYHDRLHHCQHAVLHTQSAAKCFTISLTFSRLLLSQKSLKRLALRSLVSQNVVGHGLPTYFLRFLDEFAAWDLEGCDLAGGGTAQRLEGIVNIIELQLEGQARRGGIYDRGAARWIEGWVVVLMCLSRWQVKACGSGVSKRRVAKPGEVSEQEGTTRPPTCPTKTPHPRME